MNEYACPSSSAFIDSQFVTMNFISDFLTSMNDKLDQIWMLGFGDLPADQLSQGITNLQ